jgi:endoglucanase
MKELIKKLVEISSPSGREDAIREAITEEVRDYVDELRVDALGNLICMKKGKSGKKLLLDAHMDEIGVVVTHIDDKGFLRIDMLGGVSPYMLLGSRIIFESGAYGIVSTEGESAREAGEIMKNLDFAHRFVDIGASSREEAEKKVSENISSPR